MSGQPMTKADLDRVLGFELSDEQWAAVSAPLTPAVVIAGAGSGKTTSMAARVAYLVGSGLVRPDQVLGLTFTTKATAQLLASMRRSIAALPSDPDGSVGPVAGAVDGPPGEPIVSTYHAFGARLLAEHGIRLGREPSAPVLTDGAREQLAYRLVCRSTLPLGQLGRSAPKITTDLLSLDDELAELAVDPATLIEFDDEQARILRGHATLQAVGQVLLATSEQRSLLARLVGEWRQEKSAREVIDFADQIRLAGELVARFPDVAAELRDRFPVVLLDEYQDTSVSQRKLLQAAFGSGHPVLAVGDPCQAIYGWRGASVANIDAFVEHFPAGDGGTMGGRLRLTQNRRSGPAILDVANRTAEPLRAAHPDVRELTPGATDKGPGVVTCALFDTYDDELDWVVQEIERTRAGVRGRGVAWRDIAVLAATGADLVRIETALRARAVPTYLVGAAALLAQPAVIELHAMLQVLVDPTANPAVVRLLAGPRWRIGPRDLAALGRRARALAGDAGRGDQETLAAALDSAVAGTDVVDLVSLAEAVADLGDRAAYSPAAVERLDRFARELAQLRTHAADPDFLWRVVHTTGLAVEVAQRRGHEAARQRQALHAFIDLAAGFTEHTDGRRSIGAFLARLADAERLDVDLGVEMSGSPDAVQLLTVHKAKGLEFGYVFVPFVANGAFPGGRGRATWLTSRCTVPWPLREDRTKDLESYPPTDHTPRSIEDKAYRAVLAGLSDLEDQRLAYVAFTRAERGLAVSGHWWGPSQKKPRGPARFLETVHEACLDGVGQVAHWAPAPAEDATNPLVERAAAAVGWPSVDPDRESSLAQVAADVRRITAIQPMLPQLAATAGPASVDERVAQWDLLAASLLAEAGERARSDRVVRLPSPTPATLLARALSDPTQVAMDVARPMPRRPAPAARLGTVFHAWVETRFGQQSLLDPDDVPAAADADIVNRAQLDRLTAAFAAGPYADRTPVAVEAPFTVLVGGRVVAGRIDAVFVDGDGFEVVDWKTGSARNADPAQLAIYRLAWSSLSGVPIERVRAAFAIVATGEVLRPDTDALVARLVGSGEAGPPPPRP